MSDDIIEAVRLEVPRMIDAWLPHTDKQGRCLPATRIGLQALAYFGVKAEPYVTVAVAGNAAWREWMNAGMVPPMPDEAWSVGTDPVDKGSGFAGHLVVLLGDGRVLDLDSRSMRRPMLPVPDTVLAEPCDIGWESDEIPGGLLMYLPHRKPPKYTHAPDWRKSKGMAGPVIRRMRERWSDEQRVR